MKLTLEKINKAKQYLSNKGYGTGSNFTVNSVANLMAEWVAETAKTLTGNMQAEKEYNKRKKDTMENQARHIWKKNLKGYNDIMRLDSIILKAMVEFAEEYHEEQKVIEKEGTVNWIE